mmetsp:Transcript_2934/g.5282  ORF Transcript_2934/g.5282 Transcript_2934/m.5282 type:complete len:226 (+) Transcript_2934:1213-1890(+)
MKGLVLQCRSVIISDTDAVPRMTTTRDWVRWSRNTTYLGCCSRAPPPLSSLAPGPRGLCSSSSRTSTSLGERYNMLLSSYTSSAWRRKCRTSARNTSCSATSPRAPFMAQVLTREDSAAWRACSMEYSLSRPRLTRNGWFEVATVLWYWETMFSYTADRSRRDDLVLSSIMEAGMMSRKSPVLSVVVSSSTLFLWKDNASRIEFSCREAFSRTLLSANFKSAKIF